MCCREAEIRPSALDDLIKTAKRDNHRKLYINYNTLEEIPRNVLEITSLEGLFVKRNLLKALPSDLWRLRWLKTLYLTSNQITFLPDEIGKCENLESLNVDNNSLKYLPKTIGKLKKLKRLQVSNNALEEIAPEIGQVRSLEVLELMQNHIQYLPNELSKCSNLRMLFAGANLIQDLPKDFLKLSSLKELSLSRNSFTHLPQDLNRLRQLKSFVLDNNQDVTVLPGSMFKIPSLEILGIHGCGSSNNGKTKQEILEQYITKEELKNAFGNVEPLLELCLRHVYGGSTKQQALLPKSLQMVLKTPKGLCHYCRQGYFKTAFLQLYDSTETLSLTHMTDKLYSQIKDTKCYFIFCFCSFNCLTKYTRPAHIDMVVGRKI